MSSIQELRREVLVEAIRKSGLNIGEFSQKYLVRSRSTVYRWLSGEIEIPAIVGNWLRDHADDIVKGE
jgi:hypothetical protein